MCEEKLGAEMLRLDGGFWEGGVTAVEKGVAIPSREEAEQEELEWEKEVESTLKSLGTVQVPEGYVRGASAKCVELDIRTTVPRQTTHSTYPNYQSYLGARTSCLKTSQVVFNMVPLIPPPRSEHDNCQAISSTDRLLPGSQL